MALSSTIKTTKMQMLCLRGRRRPLVLAWQLCDQVLSEPSPSVSGARSNPTEQAPGQLMTRVIPRLWDPDAVPSEQTPSGPHAQHGTGWTRAACMAAMRPRWAEGPSLRVAGLPLSSLTAKPVQPYPLHVY